MNQIPESLQLSLLTWLLQEPILNSSPVASRSSAEISSGNSPDATPLRDRPREVLELDALDPLDSEEISFISFNFKGLESYPFYAGEQPLTSGEIPAMQDRFYALLKHRLQTEIQQHPPLFPWETEISDYEPETDYSVMGAIANPEPASVNSTEQVSNRIWTAQLRNLNLPVAIPENVFAQLLDHCQQTVQSSLREGAKLVRAVESLFPNQSQALNQLAGLVIMSPSRSGTTNPAQGQQQLSRLSQALGSSSESDAGSASLPSHYEAATPAQQMVLSLLAAQEIISTLTLTVSSAQPVIERQWLTAAGLLTLEIDYQPQAHSKLRIQANLPCGGSLQLQHQQAEATAQRQDAGYLSLELFDVQPHQSYALAIQFQEPEQTPLTFTIRPIPELED